MTKFADMPKGSLAGWLAWCAEHDWGQGPNAPAYFDEITGEMVTFSAESDDGFTFQIREARHTTPRELKEWAGY